MKNTASFLLVIALCLGLCACSSAPASTESTTPITSTSQNMSPAQENVPVEPIEAPGPSQSDLIAQRTRILCGQWLLSFHIDGIPSQILFHENNTCIIDNKEYTWSFSFTNGDAFGVDVLDGNTVKYELSVSRYSGTERAMLLYSENGRGEYLNPEHYDIIEITPDNWQNYFEIRRDVYWQEDAFGTVTGLRGCGFTLCLKEEYVSRLSSVATGGELLSKNAIEISFSYGRQTCDIDLQKKLCTPTTEAPTYESTLTCMGKLAHHSTLGFYEMSISASGMRGASGNTIPYLYDFTLLRAECPLYLLKDEFALDQ